MDAKSTPELRRIVFVGLGAIVMGLALVFLLLRGPSGGDAVNPRSPQAEIPAPIYRDPQDAFTSEQPVVLSAVEASAPLLVAKRPARSDAGRWSFTLPGDPERIFMLDLDPQPVVALGTRPVWVHVAASWCAPCLWELQPLFDRAQRLAGLGVDVVLAVIDADGDPVGGMRKLVAARAQLQEGSPLVPPPSLIVLADDARQFSAMVDEFFVGGPPRPTTAAAPPGASGNTRSRDRPIRKQGIPLSLVFDRCGNLLLIAQNRHNRGTFDTIERTAQSLAGKKNACL